MHETTAEIWIGQDQTADWAGTQGGMNASHLLLLRENSRPAWMLFPGNFHDSVPPVIQKPRVWFPTVENPLQDALLLFAVMGAKIPEVQAVFNEFEKSRSRARMNLVEKFPRGLPKEIYRSCQRHLIGWQATVSVGDYSLIAQDLDILKKYSGLRSEIRLTQRGGRV
jgi:hypothetical protein